MANVKDEARVVKRALVAFPLAGVLSGLFGILVAYAYAWLSQVTEIDLDLFGDKTSVLLGVLVGLPIGAVIGLGVAHRILDGRTISAGEALFALIAGPIGGYMSVILFDLLGAAIGACLAPLLVAAVSTLAFVFFRVARRRVARRVE